MDREDSLNNSFLNMDSNNDIYMMKVQDRSLKYIRQFPANNDRIFYKDLDFLNRPIGEVSIPYYTDKVSASLTGKLKDAFPAVLLSVTRNTVQVLNFTNHKVELVSYDNIWLRRTSSDQKIFLNHEDSDPSSGHSYNESYIINEKGNKLERLSSAKCMVKVQKFIKEDDYFLYQDLDNLFAVVQITNKNGPFVIVKMNDDAERLIPIRSGRNYSLELHHQLSLAGLVKKGGYKPGKETFLNKVPKCAFLRSKHNSHEFERGYELEVICPDTREHIYMGYVSEVFSEELFKVTIIKYADNSKNKTILCDNANELLLPKRFCSRHNLKLTSPFDSHSGNDLKNFKKLHGITEPAPKKTFAQVQCYDKIEEFTRIEYYDEKGEVMVPALIVRSAENVVFLILEDRDMMKPLAFNCGSPCIFPVGTAEKYGITLVKPLDRDYEDTRQLRIDIEKNYKFFYEDLKNDSSSNCKIEKSENSDKENITFCDVYKDISKIAPKFYINHECNPGPYLRQKAIKSKPVINNGGPLASIVYYINRLLIQCSDYSSRVRVANILSCNDKNCGIIMKKPVNNTQEDDTIQYNSKGQTYICEAPFTSEEFPLYLRKIMYKLQACPNLISLTRLEEPCLCECNKVEPWFKLYVNNFVTLSASESLAGPANSTRGKKNAKRNYNRVEKRSNSGENDTKKQKLDDRGPSVSKGFTDERNSSHDSREPSESKMVPPKSNGVVRKRATTVDVCPTKLRRSGRVAGKNSESGSPSKTADTTPEPSSSPSVSPSDDNSQESVSNNSRLSTPMQTDIGDKKIQDMTPQEFAALIIAEASLDIREKVENINMNELLKLDISQIMKQFDVRMGSAIKIQHIIQKRI